MLFFLSAMMSIAEVMAKDLEDIQEIIERANIAGFYSGKDSRSEIRMVIVDSNGRKQIRQLTMLRKNHDENHKSGGDQQYLALFSRPADIKRTVFRVEKHIDKDDDRWLYFPGLDLVKRVSSSDKRTSFVGTHFFYEDVSGRNIDDDFHTLIKTTENYYEIHNKPKDKKSVEFDEYTMWVDKENFLPVKAEYKDDTGEIYRRVESLEVKSINGIPTITKLRADDIRSGGYTIALFRFIKYDIGLTEKVFSERSLRNPPKQWFARPKEL